MAEYADQAAGPYLVLALLAINMVAFFSFWRDKQLARNGASRIPESTLLSLALFGGSIGAVAGQQLFRHKTTKEPFRTYLRVIVCLQVVIGVAILATWIMFPAPLEDWIDLIDRLVLPTAAR